jgi:hypothetical protein
MINWTCILYQYQLILYVYNKYAQHKCRFKLGLILGTQIMSMSLDDQVRLQQVQGNLSVYLVFSYPQLRTIVLNRTSTHHSTIQVREV